MEILIVHTDMEIGGAETSLIGLLEALCSRGDKVSLFLHSKQGAMLGYIPGQVRIIEEKKQYKALTTPIKSALLSGNFFIGIVRLAVKAYVRLYGAFKPKADATYITKLLVHKLSLPFLPEIEGSYDACLSFINPHYIALKKVSAKKKYGWFHTDFNTVNYTNKQETRMWAGLDRIVNVSQNCKNAFDEFHPSLVNKSIVIENLLSKSIVISRAGEGEALEMNKGDIKLLSIGRFCMAKNFDNIPDICSRIRSRGLDCVWYIIGYGGDEPLIKEKIKEAKAEEFVIILGKKENPYPYIKACDLYIQPSRYEGKAVAVREAQMLGKCCVITAYETASSQLTDGIDGVVVPMDNEGCSKGICDLLKSPQRIRQCIQSCQERDYTNAREADKIN